MPLSIDDQVPKIRRMHDLHGTNVRRVGFDPAGGSRPQVCYVLVQYASGAYISYLDVPYAIVLAVLNAVDPDHAVEHWIVRYYTGDTLPVDVVEQLLHHGEIGN